MRFLFFCNGYIGYMRKYFLSWLWLLLAGFFPVGTTSAAEKNPLADVFPESIKTIAVVAPGLPGSSSKNVDAAIKYLTAAGKKVKVMPNARLGEPCRDYRSFIDWKLRAADLEQAWLDEEVDLILCVRGGNGTPGLVEHLNWDKLRTRPDIIVQGFSDITALHLAMLKEKAGHPVCAPSLTKLLQVDDASRKSVYLGLSNQPRDDVKLDVLHPGRAEGIILAGHLRLLDTINQTRFKPDTAGKVIFIECPDLNEKKAASTLENLRRSGFFDHCAAVVFGRLSKCKKAEKQVKIDFANKVQCPVFDGFPYSHTQKNHLLDLRKKVAVSEDGVLKFL